MQLHKSRHHLKLDEKIVLAMGPLKESKAMPRLNANGIEIYYELHGKGKPLVLIAGHACDHTFWNEMLNDLTKRFQVLIFDNRGIGQSADGDNAFTLETHADDTMALLKALDIRKPHVLGQSMGGMIAQLIAKNYPDQIDSLILLNTTSKTNFRTQSVIDSLLALRKANTNIDLLLDAGMPWFLSSDYLSVPGNITKYKQYVINNPYQQTVENQQRQCEAIQKFDARRWLSNLAPSAFVISAQDDIITLPVEGKHLADTLKNADFFIVKGGHSSPIEHPDAITDILMRLS